MKIFTPATSANLGPGFDCLGLALSFYNEVIITKQTFFSIKINGEGSDRVGLKKNNTFINIFKEIYKNLGGINQNFRFEFNNFIPFSRGLGSSSSTIVAAIVAAYEMSGRSYTKQQILNEALVYENHPDNISPAVYGGFVSSIVYKNKILSQKCEISNDIKAVLVIPNLPINTKISRQKLPKALTLKDAVCNLSSAAFLTACFMNKDYESLKFASNDKIHENIRMQILPELFEVRKIAYENKALLSTLSGSGSTFLNIIYEKDAQNLANIYKNKNYRVKICDFDNFGFRVVN